MQVRQTSTDTLLDRLLRSQKKIQNSLDAKDLKKEVDEAIVEIMVENAAAAVIETSSLQDD